MRGTARYGLLALLVPAIATTVACSSTPSSDAVGWADRVCGALGGFTRTVSAPPALDPTQPVKTVDALRAYLTTTTAAVDETLRGLDGIGPSPLAGGDDYVANLRTTLTGVRQGFGAASDGVSRLDLGDPGSVIAALPTVLAPLQQLGTLADPTQGLESTDALKAATEQAPQCRSLRAG